MLARLAASAPLRLAIVAFVVYNANLRSITSHDTYPTRLLPISLLTEFDLDLDEFEFLVRADFLATGSVGGTPYFIAQRRGHWISSYPVMPALLATPVYVIPVMLGLHEGPPLADGVTRVEVVATILSKLVASLAAALSVALVYLMLLRFVPRRSAVTLALVYAFATSTWSVTSQGLWHTAFSQPLLALALYALVRARERAPATWIGVAGTALAFAVACRPPMVLIAAVLAVYAFIHYPRFAARFSAAPIIIGTALLAYNRYYFAATTGGYGGPLGKSHPLAAFAVWEGFRGLLISPSRGIIVYSPILAPAFAGMISALFRRSAARDRLFTFVAAGIAVSIAQYSSYQAWNGAFGFSYRFLAELLPAFMLMLVPVWGWCVSTPVRRGIVTIAFGYSVAVQVVGAFFYPCDWYRVASQDPDYPARFFSWREMELVQCVRAGPVDPDGLRAIRRMLGIPGEGRDAR